MHKHQSCRRHRKVHPALVVPAGCSAAVFRPATVSMSQPGPVLRCTWPRTCLRAEPRSGCDESTLVSPMRPPTRHIAQRVPLCSHLCIYMRVYVCVRARTRVRACVRVCVHTYIHTHTHGGSFYQLPAHACHHARTHLNVRMCVYISHPSCCTVLRSVCAGRLDGSGHLSFYGGNIRARLSPRQRVDVQSSVEEASHIDHRERVDMYTTSRAGCENRLSCRVREPAVTCRLLRHRRRRNTLPKCRPGFWPPERGYKRRPTYGHGWLILL